MKNCNRVWVVEILNSRLARPRWEPTVDATLTRAECMQQRREWKTQNPDDHFRVCEYTSTRWSR